MTTAAEPVRFRSKVDQGFKGLFEPFNSLTPYSVPNPAESYKIYFPSSSPRRACVAIKAVGNKCSAQSRKQPWPCSTNVTNQMAHVCIHVYSTFLTGALDIQWPRG